MAIAGGNITLDSTEGMDKISQTEKVTSPYFSTGDTTLSNEDIITSSVADANEDYFFGISKTGTATTEEFNVAFGSTNGVGALVETGSKSETEAIYKQFASTLLAPTEVTGGFFISRNNSLSAAPTNAAVASGKDEEIYVMTGRRSNMKDRINKGTWTVTFSGSAVGEAGGLSGSKLELTDDSANDSPTATPVGDRYNIVSGTAGTISGSGASDKTYGFFYPDMGMLVFSATELSASMPGSASKVNTAAAFDDPSFFGFGFPSEKQDLNTGLRLVNCLRNSGSITFRDEEDQISAQYFCRVRSGQMNFSNNPTFVSGSLNELRQTTMKGNPNTFITSVQLYNNAGEMVAVGNLSTPLKKNFSSEATIKVKLTY